MEPSRRCEGTRSRYHGRIAPEVLLNMPLPLYIRPFGALPPPLAGSISVGLERSPEDLEFPVPRRYLGDTCATIGHHAKATDHANSGSGDRPDRAFVRAVCCPGPYRPPAPGIRSWRPRPARTQVASQESERSATPASLQQAQWRQAGTLPASDRNCTGGCCLFACAACCAAGLPSPVAFVPFSPVDNARCVCPVTDVAGPRA